jgi:DNA mismatch endonuclease (patch repair protein)
MSSGRPPASSAAVSERMSRLRRRDTTPETLIRSALHRRGLRFRIERPLVFDRRRRADIVFPREQVAVFVDGCFWHSCPEHATFPRANAAFWREKLQRNVDRDRDTDRRLEALGWTVVRVWEHEDPEEAADGIAQIVRAHRVSSRS